MAEIWKAEDPERPGRVFALKRVRSDCDDDADFRRMLLDEAEIVRRLEHPNIARVYQVVESGPHVGIVMELVEGLDLTRLQRFRGRRGDPEWPLELAMFVVRQMLEGLDFAHDAKDEEGEYLHLVHRDVSPGNVMIDARGRVKIVDFGIAKAAHRQGVTEAGNVKGKFRYMAPEQIRGEPAEPATDIFSAAIVLWELLAGVRIFDELGFAPLMIKVANAHLPSLREARPGLPEAVYRAFERATALEPRERFPSAKAFQEALDAALYEFDHESCAEELVALVKDARADASRAGLERALERAKGVAGGLEEAILSALEAPDRIEESGARPALDLEDAPPEAPEGNLHRPPPTPTRTRAVPLVESPPKKARRRRGPPPPPLPSDTEEAGVP